jgi:hypothetical protein
MTNRLCRSLDDGRIRTDEGMSRCKPLKDVMIMSESLSTG